MVLVSIVLLVTTINFTSITVCYFIKIYAFQGYKKYKDHNTHWILFQHNHICMDIFFATSLSNCKLLFYTLISSLSLTNFFVSITSIMNYCIFKHIFNRHSIITSQNNRNLFENPTFSSCLIFSQIHPILQLLV